MKFYTVCDNKSSISGITSFKKIQDKVIRIYQHSYFAWCLNIIHDENSLVDPIPILLSHACMCKGVLNF